MSRSMLVRASLLVVVGGVFACTDSERSTGPVAPGISYARTPSTGGGGGGGGGGIPAPVPVPGSVSGTWTGGYTVGSTDLVTLKLNQASDGTVSAVWIESLAANSTVDAKLLGSGFYAAPSLTLNMRDGNGPAAETFLATVSADGQSLTGVLAGAYQVVLRRQ